MTSTLAEPLSSPKLKSEKCLRPLGSGEDAL